MKKSIPSLITLGNLLCGFLAILSGNPFTGMMLILCGAILDLFDGMIARALNVISDFGKQLDSLADIVTFGIAPAVLIYSSMMGNGVFEMMIISLIPLLAAVRLAKFNAVNANDVHFTGLPSPACGIFFASLPYTNTLYPALFSNNLLLYCLIVLFSVLMVAPIKMFSFKDVFQNRKALTFALLLLFLTIIAIVLFGWGGVPIGVIIYIILSLIFHLLPATDVN